MGGLEQIYHRSGGEGGKLAYKSFRPGCETRIRIRKHKGVRDRLLCSCTMRDLSTTIYHHRKEGVYL